MRQRVEAAFREYLARWQCGEAVDAAAYCASVEPALRDELARMIADYDALRGDAEPVERELRPGDVLGEHRLIAELGRGGMGVIWEAEQRSLGRRVALKILSGTGLSANALRRFQREAAAGGRLSHRGIVAVHGVGAAAGRHFIVQELVAGGASLADRLTALRDRPELPDDHYRWVATFFAAVAEALHVAHEAGVVHRDVKPSNILIDADGAPKVADFGLAMLADALDLSGTGHITGTPYFMSPEQASGRHMGIDHRTDVFSLGATLYEALTLRRPFEGDTRQQVLGGILLDDPTPARKIRSRVPVDLEVVCLKALEKKPERRYPDMAAMAADLRRVAAGEPISARPPGAMARVRRQVRRHPALSAAVATATVAFVAITALLIEALDARRAARVEEHNTTRALEQASEQRVRAERTEGELARAGAALYAQQISRADAAYRVGNVGLMRALLDRTEEHLRGWEYGYLRGAAPREQAAFALDPSGALDLTWSVDGDAVGAVTRDGFALVWDLDARRARTEARVCRERLTAAVWDPRLERLAWAVGSELAVGRPGEAGDRGRWVSVGGDIVALSWSPVSARLAVATASDELVLVDVDRTVPSVRQRVRQRYRITAVAFEAI